MADSLRDLFFGGAAARRELVEAVEARRTFDDVVLPIGTRRALGYALSLIHNHELIFRRWGLGERHESGQGLAFHFAGPPGTGKTICAEAIAQALGRPLLVVRYAEMESMWAGQTAKHTVEVFRAAERQDAVLFFDEADAIAGRRFTSVSKGYEREANAVVNVLLHELERFQGVVIFATNLAANIDPAFERRILTHIRFEMPGPEERERIWRVQLHPAKTPLDDDVDFGALARAYEVSGGDIRNAVLKAAQIAAAQPGPDAAKRIHQRHFEQGMEEVLAASRVMEQSLFGDRGETDPQTALLASLDRRGEEQEALRAEHELLRGGVAEVQERLGSLELGWRRLIEQADAMGDALRAERAERAELAVAARRQAWALALSAGAAILVAIVALVVALLGRAG